ncbi:MAG: hypothetical protein ACE5GX_00240 [Thermoanaerobaculia bacterium]
MRKSTDAGSVDVVRRKLLKSTMLAGGAFALGSAPYVKPGVKSFFGVRAAYAQPSIVYTISCSFEVSLPNPPVPGVACQNAVISNIIATVSPIPPVGTVLRCTPTTTDPGNTSLLPDDFLPTDAAGQVMFFPFDLTGNVPFPPLGIGETFTLNVTFDDQAAFGMAFCSATLDIVAAC